MSTRTIAQSSNSTLAINRVLRNTYLLLGANFLFSAAVAGIATVTNAPHPGLILTLAGVYGLMFLATRLSNSPWGLVAVFAFTGFLGYTLGPLMNMYLTMFSNGGQIVMTALGGTGIIFFALSGYVLTTRKDFSYLGGFLMVGIVTVLLAIVASLFFNIPGLQLAISAAFVLISSGMILFQTSEIIHGGERNYILATISLFVALYNLFVSLLQLLAAFAGNRN